MPGNIRCEKAPLLPPGRLHKELGLMNPERVLKTMTAGESKGVELNNAI